MPPQASGWFYRVMKNNVDIASQYNPRYSFNVTAGTLTVEDINRTDSGQYIMRLYGPISELIYFDLFVQGELLYL